MCFRYFILKLALIISFKAIAQKNTMEIAVPDSIKKICDKQFVSEIGKQFFHSCVKYTGCTGTKSTYSNSEIRLDYKLDYLFAFPAVKQASVQLNFIYSVYSGKGHLQSGNFLRVNKTDLPPTTKSDGLKIISYDNAIMIAVGVDTVLKKNINRVEGKFILYSDAFYWHFGYNYPDSKPGGKEEDKYIQHHVFINPFNGKVKSVYKE